MWTLAYPLACILLLLPLIWWFVLPRIPLLLPAALKVPFFDAMVEIADNKPNLRSSLRTQYVFFFIWTCLVIALAGPRYVGEPAPQSREGHNIMLVLDISGSMELVDMMQQGRPMMRLAVVKQAAMQFVQSRQQDKIGLILFGSQAYLQTPLTYDYQNVIDRLQDATVGLAGQTTSIGDALGLAIKRFQHAPIKGRVIILLTDGANNSGVLAPLKAAEFAKTEGIKVYTIGLNAENDPDDPHALFLNMAGAELDEGTLKEIASITGGQYFRATNPEELKNIYHTIGQLEKTEQEADLTRPETEYYPYPLGLALILMGYWLGSQSRIMANSLRLNFKQETSMELK